MASRRIKIVVNSLERFLDRIMRKLTLDIVANLVSAPDQGYGTPVDTGWARANWVPQIGSPRTETVGTREQAEAGNVSQSNQQIGLATIAASYRFGPRIYISNNVPYIVRLNEGSSKQAPRGFVQNAIAKAVTQDLASGLTGAAT